MELPSACDAQLVAQGGAEVGGALQEGGSKWSGVRGAIVDAGGVVGGERAGEKAWQRSIALFGAQFAGGVCDQCSSGGGADVAHPAADGASVRTDVDALHPADGLIYSSCTAERTLGREGDMNYSNLSDLELLKKLVGTRESKKLYQGSLRQLFLCAPQATPSQEKCAVAKELVKRWLGEELERGTVLSQPGAVRDFLRILMSNEEREIFVVIYLDSQNRMIVCETAFQGTLTQTSVYPREIVKAALRHNAAAVIFAHNHPSGVAEPSRADEALTQALKQALVMVDVRVLDHFIVSNTAILSFAERGLL